MISILKHVNIRELVIDIPNFPKEGVIFRDITPIFLKPEAYQECIQWFCNEVSKHKVNKIVAVESRGFLFAAPVSYILKMPLALVRKKNKLPRKKVSVLYQLEYGEEVLELHIDAINQGDQTVFIDDVLATGGTVKAAGELINLAGGSLNLSLFLIELEYLNAKNSLNGIPICSMIKYT